MRNNLYTIAFLAAVFATPVAADEFGRWHSETVQKYKKYWTENDSGSKFVIWCNPDRKMSGAVIDVELDGQKLPPSKRIMIIVDRDPIKLPSDAKGYIQTSCAGCADGFKFLWNRMRASNTVAVQFGEDRFARFSLKGAAEILPGATCNADM